MACWTCATPRSKRGRDLAKRPRIHAALEDNALDLLYPSARDELRDLVEREGSGYPRRRRKSFTRSSIGFC
jgi:hypothetical protein